MRTRIPLSAVSAAFALLCFVFSSVAFAQNVPPNIQELLKKLPPDTLQKLIKDSQPKGPLEWPAFAPQKAVRLPAGSATQFMPVERWLQEGSAIAYELEKCVVDGQETAYMKRASVFFIDPESAKNIFKTNQRRLTASLNLVGSIEEYSGSCGSKEMRFTGRGKGSFDASFKTNVHVRPRLVPF